MIPLDTVMILRHDYPVPAPISGRSAYLVYVIWSFDERSGGYRWQSFQLDIGLGTCRAGPAFRSFIEARRAHRAGITWED